VEKYTVNIQVDLVTIGLDDVVDLAHNVDCRITISAMLDTEILIEADATGSESLYWRPPKQMLHPAR
jgi:hypothetical protein